MRIGPLAVASLVGSCCWAAPAAGFSIYGPTEEIAEAARWTSTSGLAGGIRVGVDASFAAAFAPTTTDPAVVEGWVRTAFDAWENPALQFDIHFGDLTDAEITLQTVPGDPGFFGIANITWGEFDANRVLTNGQAVPGWAFTHADIDIAADRLQSVVGFDTLPIGFRSRIITRLFMHEIGHTIGLGHTNDPYLAYYDTDLVPDNAMSIDPANPFAGLVDSPNRFVGTVMSTRPCGDELVICEALVSVALSLDDIGGRDVLYPVLVPEPSLGWLAALSGLIVLRRSRR